MNLQSATGVVGDVSLSATTNAITNFGDFTVRGGDLAVVNASDLTLFGTVSAANLFFEVGAGKSIVFGIPAIGDSGAIPANLTATATGGRISLVADTFAVADPTSANSIVTTAGTVESAPATPGGTLSLGGTASGVEADVSALINTNGGTLEVGAFTNVPGGGGRVVQAGSITIDGPVDLTGKADTLRLDTTGDITEDTELGSLTVTNLAGSAVNATLNSFGNVIDNLGNFTTSGNLALVSEASLTITGPVIAGGIGTRSRQYRDPRSDDIRQSEDRSCERRGRHHQRRDRFAAGVRRLHHRAERGDRREQLLCPRIHRRFGRCPADEQEQQDRRQHRHHGRWWR